MSHGVHLPFLYSFLSINSEIISYDGICGIDAFLHVFLFQIFVFLNKVISVIAVGHEEK